MGVGTGLGIAVTALLGSAASAGGTSADPAVAGSVKASYQGVLVGVKVGASVRKVRVATVEAATGAAGVDGAIVASAEAGFAESTGRGRLDGMEVEVALSVMVLGSAAASADVGSAMVASAEASVEVGVAEVAAMGVLVGSLLGALVGVMVTGASVAGTGVGSASVGAADVGVTKSPGRGVLVRACLAVVVTAGIAIAGRADCPGTCSR